MSFFVKVAYRRSADKELTETVKIDKNSVVIGLVHKSCEIFKISDPEKYFLSYKKVPLNATDSLNSCGVAQGATLNLSRKPATNLEKSVSVSYRVNLNGRLVKATGNYTTNTTLAEALTNVELDGKQSNLILLGSTDSIKTFPSLTISSWKLPPMELIQFLKFTFGELDLRGNQMIGVSFELIKDEDYDQSMRVFESLTGPKTVTKSGFAANAASETLLSSSCREKHLPEIPIIPDFTSSDGPTATFKVFRREQSQPVSCPDLPDEFFQISSNEALSFHKSYQTKAKELLDKPLVSAKSVAMMKEKSREQAQRNVLLKFALPDFVFVESVFSCRASVSTIYDFLEQEIFEPDVGGFELWFGPPHRLLERTQMSLSDVGIMQASRITVKAKIINNLKLRNSIRIETVAS